MTSPQPTVTLTVAQWVELTVTKETWEQLTGQKNLALVFISHPERLIIHIPNMNVDPRGLFDDCLAVQFPDSVDTLFWDLKQYPAWDLASPVCLTFKDDIAAMKFKLAHG